MIARLGVCMALVCQLEPCRQSSAAEAASARARRLAEALVKAGTACPEVAVASVHADQKRVARNGPADRAFSVQSISKSLTSLAIGRLLASGAIASLDEPMATWFPEWRQDSRRAITLRHLLNQASGLEAGSGTLRDGANAIDEALSLQLLKPPGTAFVYNNAAFDALGELILRVSGRDIEDFVRQEILRPIGASLAAWQQDAFGNKLAAGGAWLTEPDLALVGELILQEGRWAGQQLLAPAFVRELSAPRGPAAFYSLGWWLQRRCRPTLARAATSDSAELPIPLHDLRRAIGENADPDSLLQMYLAAQTSLLATRAETRWLAANVTCAEATAGPVVGMRADGWQGQHLAVFPSKRLVVIRLRAPSDWQSQTENNREDFGMELQWLSSSLAQDPQL